MIDIDGNTYKTVEIGKQEWMAENLNVSNFRNGDPIPEARTDEEWVNAGDKGNPAWCYYENDAENGRTYGILYNWYAVYDPRGLAPEGWRVPDNDDWTTLYDYLGGDDAIIGKMQETGTKHWDSPNKGATNETGFTARPGGNRLDFGLFNGIGLYGFWWSASEDDSHSDYAWLRMMHYDYNSANIVLSSKTIVKNVGYSVRCMRD